MATQEIVHKVVTPSTDHFPQFQLPQSTAVQKEMIIFLMYHQVSSNAVSPCLHPSPHFMPSRRHFIITCHYKKGEDSIIKYFERLRPHLHNF